MTNWQQGNNRHELSLSAVTLTVDRIDDNEFIAHIKFGSLIKPLKGYRSLETAKQEAMDYALQIIQHDAEVLSNLSQSS